MNRERYFPALPFLLVLTMCHCATAPKTVKVEPHEGVVGYEVILDPNAPHPKLSVDREFVDPEPALENPFPNTLLNSWHSA